jgi:hypothetical protein
MLCWHPSWHLFLLSNAIWLVQQTEVGRLVTAGFNAYSLTSVNKDTCMLHLSGCT